MMKKSLLFSFTVLVSFLLFIPAVKAENQEFHITIDKETIEKGYTVTAFDDSIKLSLVPGILDEATPVDVKILDEEFEWPWQVDRISQVYQFEFENKDAYDNHKPFYIQLSYDEDDPNYKQVFFYDKNFNSWRPLPTRDFPRENFVRSLIHLPYARIAVFSHPGKLTHGMASWYAYKGGDFAASPDYPKGSKLRVYALNSDKYVDVTINDWGPERDKFPDRAIDLDKLAFAKLAPLGAGTIEVNVEPLYIEKDYEGKVLGVSESGISDEPEITSETAIVVRESDMKVLWENKSTTSRPLASLTKLVAVKVFLDTKPSLNREVAYSSKDAEYNYEWCNVWESAKLNLNDGDIVTIEDLVYASLVGSANNTIESLVRVSGMSRDEFIAKMNQKVKAWGASSTKFIEPTGLAPSNVTTALDYALITKHVFTHPIIQKASIMKEYVVKVINQDVEKKVRNTNHLIRYDMVSDIIGSKTGYLHEALYCLMVRVSHGDENLIVVLLGADTRDISFNEMKKLIRYGQRKLNGE